MPQWGGTSSLSLEELSSEANRSGSPSGFGSLPSGGGITARLRPGLVRLLGSGLSGLREGPDGLRVTLG